MRKLLVVGILCAAPAAGLAHGGSYSGPGSVIPGASTPSGPGGPGPASPDTPGERPSGPGDATGWQFWWMFNQEPYLQLKAHIGEDAPVTDSGSYRLGEGSNGNLRGSLRVSAEMAQTVIIPRLLEALRTESSNDIQSSCMIALGKIGERNGPAGGSALQREVWREIQNRLVSTSQELSETAAVALGISGSPANLPLLTALLENDLARLHGLGVQQVDAVNVRTRAFAAYGLGLIGHRAGEYDRLVINATLRKLLDGEARGMAQRDVPVACLVAIGLTPLPVDARESERELLPGGLDPGAMVSRQDQLQYLLSCYADKSFNALTRAQTPTAMARLLCRGDVPENWPLRAQIAQRLLESLAKDSKDENAIQQSCILALGLIGDCDEDPIDRSIRATLVGVEGVLEDQQSRRFALIALAQAAGHPGSGAGDPMSGIRSEDWESNARKYLLRTLSRDKTPVRQWAALALGVLEHSLQAAGEPPSPEVHQALRFCLGESRSPDNYGAFAIACGIARVASAKETLFEDLLSLHDPEARGHAAVALGLLNERSAIGRIADIAKNSKYQSGLLRSSAVALGLLGDKQLVPDLIEMLSKATSLSTQAAISVALGTIGDSRSVPALIELLGNKEVTELARAFGAVALGIVADKEDLPWNAKISVGSNYRANPPSLTDGKGGILDIL